MRPRGRSMTRSPTGRGLFNTARCSERRGDANAGGAAGDAATLTAVPALAAAPARGQDAPQRSIRIIVPTSPGDSPDIASRLNYPQTQPRRSRGPYGVNTLTVR